MQPQPIFHTAESLPPARRAMAERAMTRWPGVFASEQAALAWLSTITLPVSERWAFIGNAKTGSSSIKRFLFLMEFGVPLTVHFDAPTDINPDAVSHALTRAGVFRSLPQVQGGLSRLNAALRFCVGRHPVARAVSSFNYLCLTDAERSPWLASERLRMNATVGFDWTRDPLTPEGFLKFLDHLGQNLSRGETVIEDPHLRPQTRNVRPDLFRPDLVGRTEDLHGFFRSVADRLDVALPVEADLPVSNRQNSADLAQNLITPEAMRRIAQVFAADFDWLNETPDSWRPA